MKDLVQKFFSLEKNMTFKYSWDSIMSNIGG